jgi:peptide/nickel transport system ATP-binding protein
VELSGTTLASAADGALCFGTQLLEVRDLEVRISVDPTHHIVALGGISLGIASGEIVGLLGESGAGKTTLALALMRLLPPSHRIAGGSIQFEGRPLLAIDKGELGKIRGARISLIAQESTVLNPVMRVGDQVAEVLRAHRKWSNQRYRDGARSLLEEVELEDIDRIYASYPHQLSGGQRQRVVIAQSLACRPTLVIADEPTSSLDPTTAAAILELLLRLNRQSRTALLIISHDIKILARLAERVMVMYAGRIVEQGPCRAVLHEPLHPYTRALLGCALPVGAAAYPRMPKSLFPAIALNGAIQLRTSEHCSFQSGCSDRLRICTTAVPREFEEAGSRSVSCFKYGNS